MTSLLLKGNMINSLFISTENAAMLSVVYVNTISLTYPKRNYLSERVAIGTFYG